MKKLYIHIGHYKTGTSAIQKYCSDNADDLAKSGYFYPPVSRPNNSPTNHGDLSLTLAARHGFTPPPWYSDKKDIGETYRIFFESVQTAEQNSILISSEEFFQLALRENGQAAIQELNALLSAFDVTIVFYIREPMALLKSWYNEVNKAVYGTRNFVVFFRTLSTLFLSQFAVYKKFADVFGAESVVVRSYQHHGAEHIQDFLSAIGCDHTPTKESKKRIQIAQDIHILELARLSKKRNHTHEESTLSEFQSLESLKKKISKINMNFAKLSALSNSPIESELNLLNLFSHLEV